MNKQELIGKLKTLLIMKPEIAGSQFDKGNDYATKRDLALIAELDEPEKPVVPQFVADLYESIKDDFEYKVYELCLQYKHRGDELPQGVAWWFGDSRNKPIETLVMMHKFGYEVKKEKLYTVEIPNPNAGGHVVLCRISDGIVSIAFAKVDRWRGRTDFQLTESEIKKDFEWAWQFAEEVEE